MFPREDTRWPQEGVWLVEAIERASAARIDPVRSALEARFLRTDDSRRRMES
jgi:hypothetical protein